MNIGVDHIESYSRLSFFFYEELLQQVAHAYLVHRPIWTMMKTFLLRPRTHSPGKAGSVCDRKHHQKSLSIIVVQKKTIRPICFHRETSLKVSAITFVFFGRLIFVSVTVCCRRRRNQLEFRVRWSRLSGDRVLWRDEQWDDKLVLDTNEISRTRIIMWKA